MSTRVRLRNACETDSGDYRIHMYPLERTVPYLSAINCCDPYCKPHIPNSSASISQQDIPCHYCLSTNRLISLALPLRLPKANSDYSIQ